MVTLPCALCERVRPTMYWLTKSKLICVGCIVKVLELAVKITAERGE